MDILAITIAVIALIVCSLLLVKRSQLKKSLSSLPEPVKLLANHSIQDVDQSDEDEDSESGEQDEVEAMVDRSEAIN